MADRKAETRDRSGTQGGIDLEPLRGGMREAERGATGAQGGPIPADRPVHPGEEHERESPARREPGRRTTEEGDPPAPYHGDAAPAGGLAPRVAPGEGTAPQRPEAGEVEAIAGKKIPQERGDLEREGANAPRRDPASRGVDE